MFGEFVRAYRRRMGLTKEEPAEFVALSVRGIGRPATIRPVFWSSRCRHVRFSNRTGTTRREKTMRKTGLLAVVACVSAVALLSGGASSASASTADGDAGTSKAVVLPDPGSNAAPESFGPYYIRFYHSDKCIAIPNNGTANNLQMHQWTCFATNAERWSLQLRLIDANGVAWYWIRSAHSNKCLAIGGNSLDNGAPIVQWDCIDANNQYFSYWYEPSMPYPYYWLQVRSSYRVISVSNSVTTNGAKLIQWGRCACPAQYVAFSTGP